MGFPAGADHTRRARQLGEVHENAGTRQPPELLEVLVVMFGVAGPRMVPALLARLATHVTSLDPVAAACDAVVDIRSRA
jgi:hypothetical protein